MKVRIRELNEKDAYTSVNWRNDPSIWRFTESRPDKTITIDDEINWIRKVIKEKNSYRFAILVDEIYVGNIYITNVDNTGGEYHIFIGDNRYVGKGIAKEASLLLLKFAEHTLKLKQIILNVNRKHINAIALYEKLGFIKQVTEKDFIKMIIPLTPAD